LTFSLGDLALERPKKFMMGDQGVMGGGVLDSRSKEASDVELKDADIRV
jgi:hypothetical protein